MSNLIETTSWAERAFENSKAMELHMVRLKSTSSEKLILFTASLPFNVGNCIREDCEQDATHFETLKENMWPRMRSYLSERVKQPEEQVAKSESDERELTGTLHAERVRLRAAIMLTTAMMLRAAVMLRAAMGVNAVRVLNVTSLAMLC